MTRKLAIICIAFFCSSAWAYESLPMYNHLGTDEHLSLEGPELVDSEFLSDELAYRKPIKWSRDFFRQKHLFDMTLGSLNGTRLLSDHRLKTSGSLNERWDFFLYYFDQSDLEDTNERLVLELNYRLNKTFSLGLYGEPRAQKSEGDFGAALLIDINPNHRLRLYQTWVDFTFNKRNEGTDTYVSTPKAYGVSGTWSKKENQIEYHTRFEPQSERFFPDENKTYNFQRFYAAAKFFLGPYYLELDGGSKLERNTFTTGPSGGVDEWDRKHFDTIAKYRQGSFSYGLAYRYRHWTSNLGSVTHNQFAPLLSYYMSDQWELAYDGVLHFAGGPSSLRASEDFDYDVQHRLNAIWKINFNEKSKLRLLFSFDLDEFGSGRSWEGGNGQFVWMW